MADESKRAAAYLPWATFKTSLEQLGKGMPSRIDRSVFQGMAWNVQTQLFAALKFLGLVKGEDEPTEVLHGLVTGPDIERRARLKKVIEGTYSELIAIDLTKATRAHFEEKLGSLYGVTGDTRKKAVRFFINAAEEVGIPLSPFIAPKETGGAKTRRPPSKPRNTPKKAAAAAASGAKGGATGTPGKPEGTSRSVSLSSGGTLTLSATLDLFALNASDRAFVFGIIDKLEEYERGDKK
jgi:hypothetical protein